MELADPDSPPRDLISAVDCSHGAVIMARECKINPVRDVQLQLLEVLLRISSGLFCRFLWGLSAALILLVGVRVEQEMSRRAPATRAVMTPGVFVIFYFRLVGNKNYFVLTWHKSESPSIKKLLKSEAEGCFIALFMVQAYKGG